jgi:hypothetical protein
MINFYLLVALCVVSLIITVVYNLERNEKKN